MSDSPNIIDVSEALKSWRKQYKLTQQELASILGISLRTVIRYEKGETIPSVKIFVDIMTKMGYAKETLCEKINDHVIFPGITKLIYPSDIPPNFKHQLEELTLLPVIKSDIDLPILNAKYPLEGTSIVSYPLRKEDFHDIGEINHDKPLFGYILDGEAFEYVGIPEGSILVINPNIPFCNGDLCLLSFQSTFLPRWIISKGNRFELHAASLYAPVINLTEEEIKNPNLIANYGKVVKVISIQKPKSYFMQG